MSIVPSPNDFLLERLTLVTSPCFKSHLEIFSSSLLPTRMISQFISFFCSVALSIHSIKEYILLNILCLSLNLYFCRKVFIPSNFISSHTIELLINFGLGRLSKNSFPKNLLLSRVSISLSK